MLGDLRPDVVDIYPDAAALPRGRVRPDALAAKVPLPCYGDDGWNLGLLHHGHTADGMVVTFASADPRFREPLRAALWHMVNAAPPADSVGLAADEPDERWADGLGGLSAYPGPGTCHGTWGQWCLLSKWLAQKGILRLADVTYQDFEDWAAEAQRLAATAGGRRNRLVAASRLWVYSQSLPEPDRLPRPPWTSRNIGEWIGDDVPSRGENTTAPISTATMSPLLVTALFYVDLYLAWLDGRSDRRDLAIATWPSLDPDRSVDKRQPRGRLTADDRSRLAGACLVVVAYLTGMRADEVLSLARGCAKTVEGKDGTKRYEITGTESKGVRDRHGRHITAGRKRKQPWITIEPAYRALLVLEALAQDTGVDLLFAPKPGNTGHRLGQALTSIGASQRIAAFVAWANKQATRNGHPVIPPCPRGRITMRRFRRTLAWHIVRQPGGLIALGVQYGHLRLLTSQGYAGRAEAGFLDVLDLEEVALALDTIDEVAERQSRGEVISGPAAAALEARVDQAQEFLGKVRTDRELTRLKGMPHLKIYDVPETLVVCVFNAATAACLDGEDADTRRTPSLNRCVHGCGNAARTDTHIEGLRRRIAETEADRDVSPFPLAQRLDRRIRIWKAAVEAHEGRQREAADVAAERAS